MNNKKKLILEILIFILIIILISLGYNYYTQSDNRIEKKEEVSNMDNVNNVEVKEITSTEEFNSIVNSNETVLVDFYATWCMPCKMMAPVIEKIAGEKGNVKVIKVNVDENQGLATKFNVMSIPTIIVFKNGTVKKTFVGVTDEAEIVKEL